MAENFTPLTFKEAQEMIAHTPCVVLDVRDEDEYWGGHVKGARSLPLDSFSPSTLSAALPDRKVPVLTYCRSGARSREAAEALCRAGYENVYNIGSLVGWPYGLTYGD